MKRSLLFSLLVLLASCIDNFKYDGIADSNASNYVAFTTYDQFSTVTNRINNLSENELDAWEKENSFISYRRVLRDAHKEWDLVGSPESQAEFLKKYDDVLTIKDSTIVPHIKISMYQSIVNRQGIYQTGNHIHKIIGAYIATVKKGDDEKLGHLKLTDGKLNDVEGVEVTTYLAQPMDRNDGRAQYSCIGYYTGDGYSYTDEYYYNPSGCNNDRKVFLSMATFQTIFTGYGTYNGTTRYGNYYQLHAQVSVWGDRRNSLCNWNGYNTALEYKDVEFTTYVPQHTAYQTDYEEFDSVILEDGFDDYYTPSAGSVTYTKDIGDMIFNTNVNPHNFVHAYGMGGSQGVNGNFAVIYCP